MQNYENQKDADGIQMTRNYILKTKGFDLLRCVPIRYRDAPEEERQEYLNEWGHSSLLSPLVDVMRDRYENLTYNLFEASEDFTRLKGRIGTVKDVLCSFVNLIKWGRLERLDQNESPQQYQNALDEVNMHKLRTHNGSLSVYIYDSFFILYSYNLPIYIHDVRDATRGGRVFLDPADCCKTSRRHINYLIETLYNKDLLSAYIYNDFKYF